MAPQHADEKEQEKDIPFDFQKFLDQMKLKGAEPVAKYLRSFLSNFAKKTFAVNDQVKLISNFLSFISERMRESDVWRNTSDVEFENATEAMEKLVMNRLYDFTFTPQIDRSNRTVTTDDLERDLVFAQRIQLFAWVQEEHLDIPSGEAMHGFYHFAEQELLKINHYKAPRDKLICILNCCKVIFGLIRHSHSDEGADAFVPILIFVVLKANPNHLISNVEYINRFRSGPKLQSEAGYYLSSLMGAISFIETMDHTSLSSISQAEFEKNVESAIQGLPGSPDLESPPRSLRPAAGESPLAGEESARPLSLPTPNTIAEDTKRFIQRTGDLAQQTISKPLNILGRVFSDVIDSAEERLKNSGLSSSPNPRATTPERDPRPLTTSDMPQQYPTAYEPRIRPPPSPPSTSPRPPERPVAPQANLTAGLPPLSQHPVTRQPLAISPSHGLPTSRSWSPAYHDPAFTRAMTPSHPSRQATPNLDFGALTVEIERIDLAHQAARDAARDTLLQIFPAIERDVAEMVLDANENDLGRSIEALLEMTGGGT